MRTELSDRLLALGADFAARRPAHSTAKARHDYVTDIDHEADARLTEMLGGLTPGVPVLSEERAFSDPLPSSYWLIDPIDGTGNLIAGLPFFALSVALIEDRRTVLATVIDIPHAAAFSAARGGGAWLGTERLVPPAAPQPLLSVSSGVLDCAAVLPGLFPAIRRCGKIRNLGSQATQLAYAAAGRLGAVLSVEAKAWDDAAGALIAEEAGLVYSAQPVHPGPDADQLSYCCHPALGAEIPGIMAQVRAHITKGTRG